MGFGDDLMITATAAKVKKKYPESQIVIGNIKKKEAYHSIVYDNNPNISDCRKLDPKKPIHIINYHQGNRPYIDYEKSLQKDKYIWNKKYKPTPGEIYFTLSEISIANKIINNAIKFWNKLNKNKFKAIIFLELSSTKLDDIQFGVKHENKSWGFNNWLKLIDNTKDEYLYIQSKHANSKNIEGVYLTENINFREACAVLNKSDLYVGPEGGFGHAAAALRKKAVLYFGGWIAPEVIGYNFHKNIYFDHKMSPCGEYKKICNHCIEARNKITTDVFEENIKKSLSSI